MNNFDLINESSKKVVGKINEAIFGEQLGEEEDPVEVREQLEKTKYNKTEYNQLMKEMEIFTTPKLSEQKANLLDSYYRDKLFSANERYGKYGEWRAYITCEELIKTLII